MNFKAIKEFVLLLEAKGLPDSATIVAKYILPEANCYQISLYTAAKKIAGLKKEPGNIAERLSQALSTISKKELQNTDINKPP